MGFKYFDAPGKRYYHQDLEFWSQGGMVHVYDNRDDSFVSVSPREWAKRAKAIGGEIPYDVYSDERIAREKLCNEMVKCAKEAEFYGDPTSQEVSDYKMRHKSKSGHFIQGGGIGMKLDGAMILNARGHDKTFLPGQADLIPIMNNVNKAKQTVKRVRYD